MTKVILLLMSERAELSTALVVSTTAGVVQLDKVPPTEVAMMVAMMDGS